MCPCDEKQTMSHIVNSCPLTKLNGVLCQLHSSDDEANYGSWCIRQKNWHHVGLWLLWTNDCSLCHNCTQSAENFAIPHVRCMAWSAVHCSEWTINMSKWRVTSRTLDVDGKGSEKNGWTDRHAVLDVDSGGPTESCADPPRVKSNFRGCPGHSKLLAIFAAMVTAALLSALTASSIIQSPITSCSRRYHSVCQASANGIRKSSGRKWCGLPAAKGVVGLQSSLTSTIALLYSAGRRNYVDSGPGVWSGLPSFYWVTVQKCWHQEADADAAAKSLCLHYFLVFVFLMHVLKI